MKLFLEERGQISAELLIILAAVTALAIVLITQLKNTGAKSADALEKKAALALEEIDKIK
ncbi:MAG TPA: class III signal peptide-containing protein [archaeon]|nr:class III signal peptide-containing protein [archaeon]